MTNITNIISKGYARYAIIYKTKLAFFHNFRNLPLLD